MANDDVLVLQPGAVSDPDAEPIDPGETFIDPGVPEGTRVIGVVDEGEHQETVLVKDTDENGEPCGWHKDPVS